MSLESKERLALAVIDFLNSSKLDGTLNSDETESIDVATQCIADAFKIDPSNKVAMDNALGGRTLFDIYRVFEKMKGKSAQKPASSSPEASSISEEDKTQADAYKMKGNAAMAQKDFHSAVDFYTQAINLQPNHPIYLSNRAAAYTDLGQYNQAIKDAEIAVDADPSYSKAWSRLGHARYLLGNKKGAMEAYKAGLDSDPSGVGSPLLKAGYEKTKTEFESEQGELSTKDSPAGSGDLGGFDIGSLLGNPEQMSKMMPLIQNMLKGGEGGTPDFQQALSLLAQNPELQNMAKNLFGGRGAGPSSGSI